MLKYILVFCLFPAIAVSSETIELDSSTCDGFWGISKNVYEDDVYLIKWSGQPLSDTCKIKFNNKDTERKLCIKASTFSISDCNVKVIYYGGLIGNTKRKTYSCYDNPEEFCGKDFDDGSVELDAINAGRSPGYFTIRVYSKSTSVASTAMVIGISVSVSLVVFAIIIVAVIIVIVRRRRAAPASYTTPRSGAYISTGYQQAGPPINTFQQAYPAAGYPQQAYPPSGYPQQPATYPQQPSAYPQQPATYPHQPAVYPPPPAQPTSYNQPAVPAKEHPPPSAPFPNTDPPSYQSLQK